MKRQKLFLTTILSASLLFACSGNTNSGPAATKDTGSAAATSNGSSETAAPKAGFSAKIDGAAVTGNGVDSMQMRNAAFVVPGYNGEGHNVLFYLFSSKDGQDKTANYSLRFSFPDKTGVYTTKSDEDATCCSLTLQMNIYKGELAKYTQDAIRVSIDSISGSRVSGTFSGTLTLSPDTPRVEKKQVTITDGKFDIPFSTSKLTPP